MGRLKSKAHRWCVLVCVVPLLTASVPPAWWRKGFARKRVGSVAEAELLSQLAVLLMPNEPIEELFRSFPSPEGWGGHYLEPDLTAYGVLKDESAALFVEYDGYWRHGEKEGVEMDALKNAALLDYAPPGSYVVRVSRTQSTRLDANVVWVQASQWRSGDGQSLSRSLVDVVRQVQVELCDVLCPGMKQRLHCHVVNHAMLLSDRALSFTQKTVAAMGRNTSHEISLYLNAEGFGRSDADRMLAAFSRLGISIEQRLQPHLRFLLGLGLRASQVSKAVARCPLILGFSIERNLKPTVQWLRVLGLSETQVAKAVACKPQILGYSIEQNLKPTVQWLLDLGLSTAQVAKAVAGFPHILGYSTEENLKPTVRYLYDLGLSKVQVAKVVARFAPILGLSIEQNLKPTAQWLLGLGLSKAEVAKAVAWKPQIFGYSLEQKLKAIVQWLRKLGLSKGQIAKVVGCFPQVLGLSIEKNLVLKHGVLMGYFGRAGAAALIARLPPIIGYSLDRLTGRLSILQALNKTEQLTTAMPLTPANFQRRFGQ